MWVIERLTVGLRLFLPESWTSDADRMSRAGVPEARRAPRTKPEIALIEIDRVRAAGLIFGTVLADAGYGMSAPFRQGLSARGLTWAVGIPGRQKVYPADVVLTWPDAGRGRPRKNPLPDPLSRPAEAMLAEAAWTELSWRTGTKGALKASFAAVRVRVADGPPQRILDKGQQHLPGEEAWLVGEHRVSGERKYYLSNLPADADLQRLAATIKARWACEQAHQPMKEELGLDHFEGRSWTGLHRHALMTMIAFAFLQYRRLQAGGGKKGSREGRLSRASPPSAARSPPFYRSRHNAVRTAVSASGDPLIQNCQRSASGSSAVGSGILMLRLPGFDEAVGTCMPQSPRADEFDRHRIVAAAAGVCRSRQTGLAAHSRPARSAQTRFRSRLGCAGAVHRARGA